MTPWTDRSGKFSPLKAVVLAGSILPAVLLAYAAATGVLGKANVGLLGPRPLTEAIHETGDWAIRFLLMSLAVTPLRRIAQWPKLIMVRRMLGLSALFYALTHLTLYWIDQNYDVGRVVSEIALRFYLTIGFAALLGLSILGATSTDAMIRRLGGNWNRLHKIVYAIGLLAALHFFIQTKADVYEATFMAGLLALLLLYRLAHWRGFQLTKPVTLILIAAAAAALTAAIEFSWYGLATGISPWRVLQANLQFSYVIRPAWWVLAVGLGMSALAAARPYFGSPQPQHGRRAVKAAARAEPVA